VRKFYKCDKCGSMKMKVERTDSCKNCSFNGFYLDDNIAIEIGFKEGDRYCHDDEIKKKAEEIFGSEIERTEVPYEGACGRGIEMAHDGCWYITCYECGAKVDGIPYASC